MACLLIQQTPSLMVNRLLKIVMKAAYTVRLADARDELAENVVDANGNRKIHVTSSVGRQKGEHRKRRVVRNRSWVENSSRRGSSGEPLDTG
jgi:hypothetical protein